MTEPDDHTLLDRWRGGDGDAGQELFGRHFDRIYRFFETKLSSEADELTQATFLACVRARDQFRGESSFRTYLFTIARNELYRFFRERAKHGVQIDVEMSSIANLATTPRTKIARTEDQRALLAALQQLPIAQQTLVELHYWEDMGPTELAAVFECPEVTIRTRLHRARVALRDEMERYAAGKIANLDVMDRWARETGYST
ncbi:MAG TPA: sigma-70 family RNA polymerase sigma factor [Kofleriaceae bacterium]|jgi:RNA polymerase sigma-70 factor (ECF subfamily)|nr:sigma-70 family RNA polymerase sigma factor [Kofleriaceae bacterium]